MHSKFNTILYLKRVILSTLVLGGFLSILFIALVIWSLFNSYHRDTVQEVVSPDKNSTLAVKLDSEDDPYYVFELTKNGFLGGTTYLGECQLRWHGPEYTILKWQDNKHFLFGIKQNNKLVKTVVIDTEAPRFPCLKPGEVI